MYYKLSSGLRKFKIIFSIVKSRIEKLLGVKPKKQILICGYPRSGTSLLYNMLATSLDGFRVDKFEVSALNRLHLHGNHISKAPTDIMTLSDLPRANLHGKDIYVIVLSRDIRDVLTSKHPNLPSEYFIGYDHSWWPKQDSIEEWVYTAPGIGEIYEKIEQAKNINNIKLIIIRFEDLLMKTQEVQRYLEKELELNFINDFNAFHEKKDSLPYQYSGENSAKNLNKDLVLEDKPVDATRAGKWRKKEYSSRIKDQFEKFPQLFDILIAYNYEADRAWFSEYLDPVNHENI